MRITIVGAGPIGCYLGQLLKCYGFSPLLLEEHSEVGIPKHCAGVVGSSFFDASKIPLPREIIKKEIHGAIISYKNQSFILKRRKAAFVIDREKLDKKLSLGLEIQKETKLVSLEKRGEEYLLYTNKGIFRSDLIIGADGARSKIRKLSGLKLKPIYYRGVQFRIRQRVTCQDMVQVYFTKPFLQFCWIIPEDENVTRVGGISPFKPLKELKDFMEKMKIKGEIIEKMGGVLPIGYGVTVKDNIILVGDAACQVKPLSGGGLYYGIRCAEILAHCIKKGNLSSYDTKWKKAIGGEIRSALRIKKILEKVNIKLLEKLFTLAKKNSHLIEDVADFEHHSVGVFSVMKKLGLSFPGMLAKPSSDVDF
ncbi:NAD(P)/FAD-dependent oxidoreductase [Candidatus Aerophobetes bacterium]|nr:NAD(P)/FAD-dependent oxidoreductase [Candidatus Aerophobetes bacterium]